MKMKTMFIINRESKLVGVKIDVGCRLFLSFLRNKNVNDRRSRIKIMRDSIRVTPKTMSYWNTVFVVLLVHLIFVSGWPFSNVTQINSNNRTIITSNIYSIINHAIINMNEMCNPEEQLDYLGKCKKKYKNEFIQLYNSLIDNSNVNNTKNIAR